jgi:hypothetical protein
MQAHHKQTRKQRPDRKFDVTNGVTLFPSDHEWCHRNPAEAEKAGLLGGESYEVARRRREDEMFGRQ